MASPCPKRGSPYSPESCNQESSATQKRGVKANSTAANRIHRAFVKFN